MSRQFLQCHPKTSCAIVQRLLCDVSLLDAGDLQLNYCLEGDLQGLLIPKIMPSEQADNLWEHTCFEAFIALEGERSYYEYNFSPSHQWAVYAFSDYRKPISLDIQYAPRLQRQQQDQRLSMKVSLAKAILPYNPKNKPLQIGLSTVIETKQGDLSYWALKHAADTLDFHHRQSFIHQLKTA